jgi:hypothetical protein
MRDIVRQSIGSRHLWRRSASGLCLALACCTGMAAETNAPASGEPKLWFQVGEELVYSIHWGVVPVGETHLTTAWVEEDGQKRLQILYRTRSSKVLAAFYPVDDMVKTIVDPIPFLPIRFSKNLKEGRHRYDEITTFDYEHCVARWESKITKQRKEYAIAADTRDLLTFMFYMRAQNVAAGAGRTYRIVADDKVYSVTYVVEGEEGIKLDPFGVVRSLRCRPQTVMQGLFVRTGEIWLWVSRDPRQIATKIVGATPVGRVRAELDEVNGPGDDFWSRRGRE